MSLRRTGQSSRVDIDDDVIRGRELDTAQKFLPDGLSLVDRRPFLTPQERRFTSQVQGRTCANIFGLVERFINAKVLDSNGAARTLSSPKPSAIARSQI